VTFDATSTPAITELHGTPFLLVLPTSAPPTAVDDLVIRRRGDGVKIPSPGCWPMTRTRSVIRCR